MVCLCFGATLVSQPTTPAVVLQILDLDLPPGSGSNLREADFSLNSIQHIQDLSAFTRLRQLSLEGNQIEHVAGLSQLQLLQQLSLANNRLLSCKGLEGRG